MFIFDKIKSFILRVNDLQRVTHYQWLSALRSPIPMLQSSTNHLLKSRGSKLFPGVGFIITTIGPAKLYGAAHIATPQTITRQLAKQSTGIITPVFSVRSETEKVD